MTASRCGWLIASLLILVWPVQGAESVSVLLQKAIYAEETEGDLDAAIKIYESIAKESDANRALVAQAMYRLGVCELKRGKKDDAEAAFRKIIGQFSDQTELIAKARERLADMGKSASAVVVRQVWSRLADEEPSRLSSDGQFISFIDWETGDLWLRDLGAAVSRKLTASRGWTNSAEHVIYSAFSPDGRQIAYDWYNKTNNAYEIRIAKLNNSKPGVLLAPTNRWLLLGDWSPDGKMLAVSDAQREKNDTNQWKHSLLLIAVADASEQSVLSLNSSNNISTLRFSPDGRYLAYNQHRNRRTEPRTQLTNDIFVVDVRKGTQTKVIEHLAREQFVGWAPHGTEILFTSERSERVDLWSLEIDNGAAKGRPRLVKADLGSIDPIGISRDGAFYYSMEVQNVRDIYAGLVDFGSGKVISTPKVVTTLFQAQGMASNKTVPSADRRLLYFCSGNKEPTAYALDLLAGERREIPNSSAWGSRIGWWWPSSDNRFLYVSLFGPPRKGGLHRVNVQTGEMIPLALHQTNIQQVVDNPIRFCIYDAFLAYGRHYGHYENPGKLVLVKHDLRSNQETEHEIPGLDTKPIPTVPESYRNRAILLADGRSFFFNRKQSDNSHALMLHDLVTGAQKEFITAKSPIGVVDTASEKMIFVVTLDERNRSVFTLYAFENSELKRKHQVTVPEGFRYRGQHWSEPHLILIKDDANAELAEMWTLSVRSGELKKIGLSVPTDNWWGLPENATTVQFQTTTAGSRDVWVMENFLPAKWSRN